MKKNGNVPARADISQKKRDSEAREMFLMFKYIFATLAMIVGISIVLAVRKRGMTTVWFFENARLPLEIIFAFLSVVFAVCYFISKKKNIDQSKKIVTFSGLFTVSLLGFLLFLSYRYIDIVHDSGRIIAIIVATVLYFIYSTQNMLLFTVSLQSSLSVLGSALLGLYSDSTVAKTVVLVFTLLLITLGVYAFIKIFGNQSEHLKTFMKSSKLILNTAVNVIAVLVSYAFLGAVNYVIYSILALYLAIVVIPNIELV